MRRKTGKSIRATLGFPAREAESKPGCCRGKDRIARNSNEWPELWTRPRRSHSLREKVEVAESKAEGFCAAMAQVRVQFAPEYSGSLVPLRLWRTSPRGHFQPAPCSEHTCQDRIPQPGGAVPKPSVPLDRPRRSA